ncbi:MAG: nitroreductase family protein [Anaerolineae bacterium]|nr:nitroreductase family protein [Anaerolineae bacterium]
MNVNEAIRSKRAVRTFIDEPLTAGAIDAILNAGRLAQSAKNTQPWQFIVVQEKGALEEMSKLGHFAGHIANAAMAVAILAPPPSDRFSILFDAGQAAAYMQLAAWELGIGSCLATIYQPEEARSLLGFPENLHVHIAISFGVPHPDEIKPRPPSKAGRKKYDEVVHWEKWAPGA